MNISNVVKERYSAKSFDENKKISKEDLQKLKDILRYNVSAANSQPWTFFIAKSQKAKELIAHSTEGNYALNTPKILNASHVIVFTAKTDISDQYLQELLEHEALDGRYANDEIKHNLNNMRTSVVNKQRGFKGGLDSWIDNQLHLSLGGFVLGAATLGINVVPLGGYDSEILSKDLKLQEKGLRPINIVPIGYAQDNDWNKAIPKSRWEEEDIFINL